MELRENHFGPISTSTSDGVPPTTDVGVLVRRLLLFEHCTLESNLLSEIPDLVRTFGFDGLITLLESGTVNIICDALTAGQTGQLVMDEGTLSPGGVLPPGSYRLATVGASPQPEHRHHYVSQALKAVDHAPTSLKRTIKLKKILVPMLGTYPFEAGKLGVEDTRSDILAGQSTIWQSIRRVAQTQCGIDVGEVPAFDVTDLGNEGAFRVDTPLTDHIDPEESHKIVERAILAAAGVNIRIHLMKELVAVTGFRDEEYPFFEEKVGFLMRQIEPGAQEERFDRIVEIANLPGLVALPPDAMIDADKLLRLRESEECREFRRWLRSVDSETDAEIGARFDEMKGRAAELIEGRTGHAVRFAITTGAGFVPVGGFVLGPLASAADTFLLEKIIGQPGPTAFCRITTVRYSSSRQVPTTRDR